LKQGIIVESVLMKSIQLPVGLASSVERKLQAEQDAMRMEFVLQQEKLEAERKIIEAKGTRDSQK
jgi:regulator of protease activity HflC (stomatin/prohibitin superfamily)